MQNQKRLPKNAKLSDYKYATALEALIGYLYLENNIERLNYILSQTYNIITEECSNAKIIIDSTRKEFFK